MHVLGVDISEMALKKSGMDAMSYYNSKIGSIIENHGENSIVCWDDFPDGARALYPILREKYNSMIRVARHRNIVYSLQHTTRAAGTLHRASSPTSTLSSSRDRSRTAASPLCATT